MRVFFQILLAVGDFFLILLSFLIAYKIRFYFFPVPLGIPPYSPYVKAGIFVSVLSIVVLKITGRYRKQRIYSFLDEFYTVFISLSFVWILSTSLTFVFRQFEYSRVVFLIGFFLSLFSVNIFGLVVYLMQVYLRKANLFVDNVVVVGENSATVDIAERIKKYPEMGYRLVEKVEDIGSLQDVLRKHSVSEAFLPLSYSFSKDAQDIIDLMEKMRIKLIFVPDMMEMITSRFRIGEIEGIPVLFLEDIPLRGISIILKRIIDILISVVGLIITFPIFLIISFLIKYSRYSTPGPALFKQERVGKDGKVFILYKFRTMIVDAEANTGPVWAKEDDERRTKIGVFLRKTSLDELPQLINVLRGEMSFVGPRPERPFFVEKFEKEIKRYSDRHKVKPGITGWAQINELRGNCDIYLRTQYDLYYVNNWSLFFDLKIILRTLFEFLFHKTAY